MLDRDMGSLILCNFLSALEFQHESRLSAASGIKPQVVLVLIFVMNAPEFFRLGNVLISAESAWTWETSTKYQFKKIEPTRIKIFHRRKEKVWLGDTGRRNQLLGIISANRSDSACPTHNQKLKWMCSLSAVFC